MILPMITIKSSMTSDGNDDDDGYDDIDDDHDHAQFKGGGASRPLVMEDDLSSYSCPSSHWHLIITINPTVGVNPRPDNLSNPVILIPIPLILNAHAPPEA